MKKHTAILIICILWCLGACNKTADEGVFVRIENSTAQAFKEVLISNKSFENINPSGLTSYQLFKNVLSVPAATLIMNNNDTVYAGFVYYDWLDYLDNGKHTLKIFEDTATISGFNCIYIKN